MTAGSPRSRSPALRSPRRIIERRIDGWIDGARGGVARGGERSRCARVFIAPYCIPIKSSGAGSRRTVKATDARYFRRRSLAARLSFFSPSRGAHPQRTISAPASLPVLNRPHCFFSAVGSHERRGGGLLFASPPLASGPKSGRRDPLPISSSRCSRGDSRGDERSPLPFYKMFSPEGNRIGGYSSRAFPERRKRERFGRKRQV